MIENFSAHYSLYLAVGKEFAEQLGGKRMHSFLSATLNLWKLSVAEWLQSFQAALTYLSVTLCD